MKILEIFTWIKNNKEFILEIWNFFKQFQTKSTDNSGRVVFARAPVTASAFASLTSGKSDQFKEVAQFCFDNPDALQDMNALIQDLAA